MGVTIIKSRSINNAWVHNVCNHYYRIIGVPGLCLLSILLIPSGNPSCVMVVATLGKFFVTISFSSAYIYTSELFPTALRATSIGSSCFFSRLGGAAASWLALAASAARMDSLPARRLRRAGTGMRDQRAHAARNQRSVCTTPVTVLLLLLSLL